MPAPAAFAAFVAQRALSIAVRPSNTELRNLDMCIGFQGQWWGCGRRLVSVISMGVEQEQTRMSNRGQRSTPSIVYRRCLLLVLNRSRSTPRIPAFGVVVRRGVSGKRCDVWPNRRGVGGSRHINGGRRAQMRRRMRVGQQGHWCLVLEH